MLKYSVGSTKDRDANLDDFVVSDDKKIKWSRDLKAKLRSVGQLTEYAEHKVRTSLYRPFTKSTYYFDRIMNDVVSVFPSIFPTTCDRNGKSGDLCWRLWSERICCFDELDVRTDSLYADPQQSQCPFYTYDEDGTNRQENITDWALSRVPHPLPRRHHHQVGHLPL